MRFIDESLKQTILSVLKKQPVQRAAIFGSFARGEEHADSDIDLLIEYSTRHTMFDILRLENELSEATSRKVDIVKYGDIKSTIKERILGQAINIL
jgi:predicted nucleotidyltransferase